MHGNALAQESHLAVDIGELVAGQGLQLVYGQAVEDVDALSAHCDERPLLDAHL